MSRGRRGVPSIRRPLTECHLQRHQSPSRLAIQSVFKGLKGLGATKGAVDGLFLSQYIFSAQRLAIPPEHSFERKEVAECMCLGRHRLLRIVLSNTDWACQSWVRVASSDLRIIVRQEGLKN